MSEWRRGVARTRQKKDLKQVAVHRNTGVGGLCGMGEGEIIKKNFLFICVIHSLEKVLSFGA